MPRQTKITVQNQFGKGLITQATGLTFPENACTDTDNCIFSYIGDVRRRPGFDFENSYDTDTIDLPGNVIVTYLWKNVASEGDILFVVTQVGNFLYFYRVGAEASLSASKHANVIDLHDFMPSTVVSVANLECQFSSGNGILFVTNRRLESFYVSYDPDADTFMGTQIDLMVRDFEGDTADPYDIDERPTATVGTLNSAHFYNLKNQGWSDTNLADWDTARADMPSNADVAWYFKDSSNAFDFTTVADRSVGNSKAPGGHYIYSPYNINRTGNGGVTDFTSELERVSTSAFFAGRVFYSGLKALGRDSSIFFSQILENKGYGNCYQANDPTSEKLFDLLPSDGGVIDILEAGTILKMVPYYNNLLVFADNGVWAITGSQGLGFVANDYSINKISAIKNISHTSFVDVEGVPFWWNLEGIYTVTADRQTNSLRVESITDQSIRAFFLEIPLESKQLVRGIYDQFTKQVQWIYKSVASTSFNDKYIYDRFLTYSLLSQGFYPWSVSTDNVSVHGITNVVGFSSTFENMNVVNGASTVVDSGVQVIAFVASNLSTSISVNKYFVSFDDSGDVSTFAENYQPSYLDWESFDGGEEYDSFFITGYLVRGGAMRKFQENYVSIFLTDLGVDRSFKIRARWNYASSSDTGRWSTVQTINVPTANFAYRPKRIKLRGHGIACQFEVFNNSTYPFDIIGWATQESGNAGI